MALCSALRLTMTIAAFMLAASTGTTATLSTGDSGAATAQLRLAYKMPSGMGYSVDSFVVVTWSLVRLNDAPVTVFWQSSPLLVAVQE